MEHKAGKEKPIEKLMRHQTNELRIFLRYKDLNSQFKLGLKVKTFYAVYRFNQSFWLAK